MAVFIRRIQSSISCSSTMLNSGAPGWTSTDQSGMKKWFSDLLNWLRTSAQGKAEAAATVAA